MKTAVTNKSTFSTKLFFGINLHDAIFAVEIKTETPAVGKTKEKIRTIGIAPLKTHAYFVAQTITARHNRRILRLFQFPSRLNTPRTAIFLEFLRRFIGNIGGIIHTALKLRLTYRNVCHGL